MKKIPLGAWFLGLIAIIMLIPGLFLGVKVMVNHIFIMSYNKGDYSTYEEEMLFKNNFPESYLPYYNMGNAEYMSGRQNAAIIYYLDALKQNPPEDKEAQIRVNLALAMVGTIDFENLDTQVKKDVAVGVLKSAKTALMKKGFATNEGDGSSPEAQKLKDDIDKTINKFLGIRQDEEEAQQDSENVEESGESSSEENATQEEEAQPGDEADVQKELEASRKGAMQEGQDQQKEMDKWSDYMEGDFDREDGQDYEAKQW